MQKILHSSSLSQELRIRSDIVVQSGCAVNREMPAELRTSLYWYGTFFYDQSIPGCALCDHPSDALDSTEVSVAVRQGWSSYTNKDSATPINCLFGGSEAQPAGLSSRFDNVLEVRLEKRHDAILQFGKFVDIAFAAKDIMADLRKAGGGGQTYITCTDH